MKKLKVFIEIGPPRGHHLDVVTQHVPHAESGEQPTNTVISIDDDDCFFVDADVDAESFVLDGICVKKEPATPRSLHRARSSRTPIVKEEATDTPNPPNLNTTTVTPIKQEVCRDEEDESEEDVDDEDEQEYEQVKQERSSEDVTRSQLPSSKLHYVL